MCIEYSAFILIGLFGLYLGAPIESNSKSANILKFDYDVTGNGPYRYAFESSDGISKEESAEIHYPNTKREFLKITGSFAYPGPDGVMYEVRYTADDQGFHPEGDHIKVPPFVPWIHHDDETIETGQKILEDVQTNPTKSQYKTEEDFSDTGRDEQKFPIDAFPVYLPSSPEPHEDDAIIRNILSTPRPSPEVQFYSTPNPSQRDFRSVKRRGLRKILNGPQFNPFKMQN